MSEEIWSCHLACKLTKALGTQSALIHANTDILLLLACFQLCNINIQRFLSFSPSVPVVFVRLFESAGRDGDGGKRVPLTLCLEQDSHSRLEYFRLHLNATWPCSLSFWHSIITRPVSDFTSCPKPKHSDYIFDKKRLSASAEHIWHENALISKLYTVIQHRNPLSSTCTLWVFVLF